MIKVLLARLHQKYRTAPYPRIEPVLPDRFVGAPHINPDQCSSGCNKCSTMCPSRAISIDQNAHVIDLGKCIFCGDCARACPKAAIAFTKEYRLAAQSRNDLMVSSTFALKKCALDRKMISLFGRSLKLRQVSAGGCNACEADINVLGTPVFDWGRFGISVVASPRHADGLLITGPVTANMKAALLKTYEAVADPKVVVAVGACAISGGLFADGPEQHNGIGSLLPVNLYIPGCPPHPYTILDGLLRMLDRIHPGS